MPKITAIPATRNIRIPEAPLARRKVAGYARVSTDSDEQFTSYEAHPLIGNIYALQCIAEMHIYLRTVHEFSPEEKSDLLYFEDPLRVAQHCWEENADIYAFRISDLIKKYDLKEVYPAAKPPMKESLKSRLEEANQMVRASSPSRAATAKGTER